MTRILRQARFRWERLMPSWCPVRAAMPQILLSWANGTATRPAAGPSPSAAANWEPELDVSFRQTGLQSYILLTQPVPLGQGVAGKSFVSVIRPAFQMENADAGQGFTASRNGFQLLR